MPTELQALLDTALSPDATPADIEAAPLPESMRAAVVRESEIDMFAGLSSQEKDPRKSLHVNEVLIAPMASALNFNTVWTSIFEPLSTFGFLKRFAREGELGARHDLPYHIVGSDAAAVVVRVGPGVTRWKAGDRVTVHCNYVDMEGPEGHDDSMIDSRQRIWGFETNFGGMAELSMVKANQLMPMPTHLTWEEAACLGLTLATSYRMLVSHNAGGMKQGDIVLIWGATGGLGGFAVQLVRNGGGIPICVVSSADKVRALNDLGVDTVIDRSAEGYRFWDGDQQQPAEWKRFGQRIREFTGGRDIDIVFEHPGRQTFGASVFVTRKGGKIITCASTSGYMHEYDNRYLWMNLKSIISSHFANYKEAWEANRLVDLGMIHPILTRTYALDDAAEGAYAMHTNAHAGKLGVLVNATEEGQGVQDAEKRARLEAEMQGWKTLQ
jgi:crotonyl-CoA reductase